MFEHSVLASSDKYPVRIFLIFAARHTTFVNAFTYIPFGISGVQPERGTAA